MGKYSYTPQGVCSRQINIELDDGIVKSVEFIGGCSGNTQGVSRLCKGMKATDVIEILKGTDCRGRGTSCPDQLAKALEEALENE
ncbi:MAG: TIGR03905 family TSCPD domain-containing protein [Ruminococcus sp.]|nr:TIGR03905 family TSCPD domain-containing protein [Ruminococcus sp.]